jgi:hypothetical protein
MKLLELLEEFIILQYQRNKIKLKSLDVALGNFQIARFSEFYCEVFFLTTGESLKIEKELINLCSSFYKAREEEIIHTIDTPGSVLWELIIVCSRIMNGDSIDPGRLKNTEEFRLWFKDKFNYTFEPLIYFSRENTIMI